MTTYEYESELRKVWLGMTHDYPDLYNINDYLEACQKANILVF